MRGGGGPRPASSSGGSRCSGNASRLRLSSSICTSGRPSAGPVTRWGPRFTRLSGCSARPLLFRWISGVSWYPGPVVPAFSRNTRPCRPTVLAAANRPSSRTVAGVPPASCHFSVLRSSVPQAGLCATCENTRLVSTRSGSQFQLCELSRVDPRFSRYPPLPVLSCEGYQRRAVSGQEEPPTPDGDPR